MEKIIRLTPQTVQADLDALGQYKGPGSLPDPNIYYRTEIFFETERANTPDNETQSQTRRKVHNII